MSSLEKNSKNNIKITLYQIQLCRNFSDYIPYNISIKYNNSKEYETELIEIQNKKFFKKSYIFNILNFSRKQNNIITLTAFKKSPSNPIFYLHLQNNKGFFEKIQKN